MRSKIAVGLLFLALSCSSGWANVTFNTSGMSQDSAGPHTPSRPDIRD
jgi:hypothetical protein